LQVRAPHRWIKRSGFVRRCCKRRSRISSAIEASAYLKGSAVSEFDGHAGS
jgi:hypothetical protein